MPRNIRIIYPRHEHRFAERLEARAATIAKKIQDDAWQTSPVPMLERQIALALDQIRSTRRMHEGLEKRLSCRERYIDTEIMRREPRPPVYLDPRLPERDMLRARLLRLEVARRKLTLKREDTLRPLEDRLLSLLEQHRQLRVN